MRLVWCQFSRVVLVYCPARPLLPSARVHSIAHGTHVHTYSRAYPHLPYQQRGNAFGDLDDGQHDDGPPQQARKHHQEVAHVGGGKDDCRDVQLPAALLDTRGRSRDVVLVKLELFPSEGGQGAEFGTQLRSDSPKPRMHVWIDRETRTHTS